ncbi:MAG: acyltransferase, partial [Acidimicrobiia bacterium]
MSGGGGVRGLTGAVTHVTTNGRAVMAAQWYLRSATIGTRVRLRGRPVVHNWGEMIIGDRTQLVSTVATLELVAYEGGRLEVGERTLLNYGTSITAASTVTIGARCLIGTHVTIMDNDFHRLEPDRRLERPDSRPISIGENVWLGTRVIVLGG